MKRSRLPLAACRGCRRPITWADLGDGTRVPLEPRVAATYRIVGQGSSHVQAERVEDLYVSHFLLCPERQQFSRGGRKNPPSADEAGVEGL